MPPLRLWLLGRCREVKRLAAKVATGSGHGARLATARLQHLGLSKVFTAGNSKKIDSVPDNEDSRMGLGGGASVSDLFAHICVYGFTAPKTVKFVRSSSFAHSRSLLRRRTRSLQDYRPEGQATRLDKQWLPASRSTAPAFFVTLYRSSLRYLVRSMCTY